MAWAANPFVKAPANGAEVQGLLPVHGEVMTQEKWGDLGVV